MGCSQLGIVIGGLVHCEWQLGVTSAQTSLPSSRASNRTQIWCKEVVANRDGTAGCYMCNAHDQHVRRTRATAGRRVQPSLAQW